MELTEICKQIINQAKFIADCNFAIIPAHLVAELETAMQPHWDGKTQIETMIDRAFMSDQQLEREQFIDKVDRLYGAIFDSYGDDKDVKIIQPLGLEGEYRYIEKADLEEFKKSILLEE